MEATILYRVIYIGVLLGLYKVCVTLKDKPSL